MKKYVETEKLKEQLKLEAGLGHVQTLADVEKIIDFCGKSLQQPQGVDKDRLIEYLKGGLEFEEIQFGEKAIEVINTYRRILAFVDSQPTTDGWIPVSSGELPKNAKDVFVTTSWGAIYIAWLEKGVWNTDNFEFDDGEVIAWQPLPPAYKESE